MTNVDVVVLAAGKGTRMRSKQPKVLHRLAGRPMLSHVLETAATLQPRRTVVVTGHGADAVEAVLRSARPEASGPGPATVRQSPQRGTGHAVQQAAPLLAGDGTVLVLNGDVPLIAPGTVRALADACGDERLVLLTTVPDDATGYGRIVRDADGAVRGIVEHKDATEAERAIREIYTGIMAVPGGRLADWLSRLSCDNAQGEYYLTDIVALAVADGVAVIAVETRDPVEVAGVNSPVQLAELERALQRRRADALLEQGVRLADPARLDVRGTLECGSDVDIDVGCVFSGTVRLGDDVRIGAYCVIANARIADGAVIHPFTHIDGEAAGVEVGADALVGPFARLRPGARLGEGVHIGNFVEVKNSTLAQGAKANHLAYLGDATVGERVNYGAGSITANYDGARKHRTVIGDDVHVGSNCVLVAPLDIGPGATIAGGSTITSDVPGGGLSVSRGRQRDVAGWKRPAKAGADGA
jgi:bifunctional UDP-N-acetylglucosamine pyrophosphorylase/glucosamine-1-phosphate N-acetyltransferase